MIDHCFVKNEYVRFDLLFFNYFCFISALTHQFTVFRIDTVLLLNVS